MMYRGRSYYPPNLQDGFLQCGALLAMAAGVIDGSCSPTQKGTQNTEGFGPEISDDGELLTWQS